MNRTLLQIAFVMLLAAPAASQEQTGPAHVYEAYYRIAFADLDEWNDLYWGHSVPVLQELQDDGVIEGWNQWQHHSGGEYNIRFVVRTYDWAAIESFWGQYLSRLEASMTPAQWERTNRMILEHRDEIWDIGEVRVPAAFEPTHIYSSRFVVRFADLEEWHELWSEAATPLLEQAMEDGLLGGWVRLDHNTGGPFNSKYLYLFDDWDKIDDVVFDRMIGTLVEQQPGQWARLNALFDQHDDIIWEPTSQSD